MGISAWLVPSAQDSQVLERLMKPSYPTTHVLSKDSYPAFQPHVTLANDLPVSKSLEDIRKALNLTLQRSDVQASEPGVGSAGEARSRLEVEFARLAVGSKCFQSVFIRCKETPKIMSFRDTFHANLDIEVKTPLFPHLSLAYIDDEDAAQGEREAFLKDLRQRGWVEESEDGESMGVLRAPEQGGKIDRFEVAEVWIVKCVANVEEWEVLDKIKLSGPCPN